MKTADTFKYLLKCSSGGVVDRFYYNSPSEIKNIDFSKYSEVDSYIHDENVRGKYKYSYSIK